MSTDFAYLCVYPDSLLERIQGKKKVFHDERKVVEFRKGRRLVVSEIFVLCDYLDKELELIIQSEFNIDSNLWIVIPNCLKEPIKELLSKNCHQGGIAFRQVDTVSKGLLANLFHLEVEQYMNLSEDEVLLEVDIEILFVDHSDPTEEKMMKILKELRNLEGKYNKILGTGDFTYRLILELIHAGGVMSLKRIAKKYCPPKQNLSIFQANVKSYYYYGEPFEKLSLIESEWPLVIDLKDEKSPLARLRSIEKLKELVEALIELKEEVPPIYMEINERETGSVKQYTYPDLIKFSRDRGKHQQLIEPFWNFFLNLPRDRIGQKIVILESIDRHKEMFVVIGKKYEIVVSVDIGPKNLDYAAARENVLRVYEIAKHRSQKDRFIRDDFFSALLICRDFSESARKAIGVFDQPRVQLMRIADFMRLAAFIQSLDEGNQLLAVWGLFLLGQINAPDSRQLVSEYIRMIEKEISKG